jgi:hypothetical protein
MKFIRYEDRSETEIFINASDVKRVIQIKNCDFYVFVDFSGCEHHLTSGTSSECRPDFCEFLDNKDTVWNVTFGEW